MRILDIAVISTFFLCISPFLHAQSLQWAKGMGGAGVDNGYSVTVDANGNMYTVGRFTDTVDFDPGDGIYNLTSPRTWAGFISKFDATGNFLWAKAIGGSNGWDEIRCINFDTQKNIVIAGSFTRTVDFETDTGMYTLTSDYMGLFICKLDSDGKYIWAKALTGNAPQLMEFLSLDSGDNIYVSGNFAGITDFDPGPDTFYLKDLYSSWDAFIAKFTPMGDLIWARNFGGADNDAAHSFTLDARGRVFITGYYQGTVDFDPGPDTFLLHTGTEDIFICELDSAGNFIRANGFGSIWKESGLAIVSDGNSFIYTTGYFGGTIDFDPGPGVSNLTAKGRSDMFLCKYDTAGQLIWAKSFGGKRNTQGSSIAIDKDGLIYTTGYFEDTTDFDPGPSTMMLIPAGASDVFIAKFDTSGNTIWAQGIGGPGKDQGFDITVDRKGSVYTVGQFEDSIHFRGSAIPTLRATGNTDILILRHQRCTISTETLTLSVCAQYTSPSGKHRWDRTGIYSDTMTNYTGCDSIININLMVTSPILSYFPNPTISNVTVQTGCQPQITDVIITDILGREIGRKHFNNVSRFDLELEGGSGTYFLNIRSGEQTTSLRIIKQ